MHGKVCPGSHSLPVLGARPPHTPGNPTCPGLRPRVDGRGRGTGCISKLDSSCNLFIPLGGDNTRCSSFPKKHATGTSAPGPAYHLHLARQPCWHLTPRRACAHVYQQGKVSETPNPTVRSRAGVQTMVFFSWGCGRHPLVPRGNMIC